LAVSLPGSKHKACQTAIVAAFAEIGLADGLQQHLWLRCRSRDSNVRMSIGAKLPSGRIPLSTNALSLCMMRAVHAWFS
jgi:hypothetical protein